LLLTDEELKKVWILRKLLNEMNQIEAMEFLIARMKETKNNKEFLKAMSR
jgi:transcription termination factor Rho